MTPLQTTDQSALEAEITLLRALIKKAQSESELIEYRGEPAIVVPYSFMRAATQMPEQAQVVEPVAWMGDSPSKGNGRRLFWSKSEAYAYANKYAPLYLHPAPLPAQQASDENSVEYWKTYAEAGVESFNLMMIELTALRAQQVAVPAWMPIETAPKDMVVMVHPATWNERTASIAKWDADQYAKNPRPYWSRDDDMGRVKFSRENPPTHWLPQPQPPQGDTP